MDCNAECDQLNLAQLTTTNNYINKQLYMNKTAHVLNCQNSDITSAKHDHCCVTWCVKYFASRKFSAIYPHSGTK